MDRRTPHIDTAFHAVLTSAGATITSVSEATGIPAADLRTPSGMTVDQLGYVGGFLRIHPSALIGAGA